MNEVEHFNEIIELFSTYKIGEVTGKPVNILGGLMHKLYKVTTKTNDYAVKWLNPSIMKRNCVLGNMISSERISNVFSRYFPVVAALNIDGQNILHLNENYYMVFGWIEGASIYPPNISEDNCREIGSTLGKIHQLNISIPNVKKGEYQSVVYNWKLYLDIGVEQDASWIDNYACEIDKLIIWNEKINDSQIKLSEYMVISHRDLDPKNVIWIHDIPYIIDWESAGYVNPYQELLEVLYYWADNGNGELDKDKFFILLEAYRKNMSTKTIDWNCVFDSGYSGMLGWLEYSLKRALGIESTDEAERNLGAEQIIGTIGALNIYDNQMNTIKKWLIESETC